MQHIHKAWSAFPTAIVSRQLANYFPGKGGTRMGGFFILRGNHPADAEFYQIESIMERMEDRFIHMPSQIYVFEP
jgi:hypothetical protein